MECVGVSLSHLRQNNTGILLEYLRVQNETFSSMKTGVLYSPGQFHSCTSPLSSGRTLLDWLCMHPVDGSTEEKATELCHQMLIQGLLHPFSDSTAELHGGHTISAAFNVRPLS